ncbi:MAG: alpha/beta hydrolase [Chloroflexota bacterium]
MIALYCIGGVVALILVAIILGASYEIVASQRARAKFADASGELVTINNHKLHLNMMGERRAEQPVVILESSVGANSLDWQLVQPTIAEHAQVISYDRAGNGWSEQASSPRTPQAIVTDLHDALQSAGIEPPYLMVGHRYGGLYVRKYQEHFPDDVIGLVLVDSSGKCSWYLRTYKPP